MITVLQEKGTKTLLLEWGEADTGAGAKALFPHFLVTNGNQRSCTLVSMGPGAIALNLIPYLPHSAARDLTKVKIHLKPK